MCGFLVCFVFFSIFIFNPLFSFPSLPPSEALKTATSVHTRWAEQADAFFGSKLFEAPGRCILPPVTRFGGRSPVPSSPNTQRQTLWFPFYSLNLFLCTSGSSFKSHLLQELRKLLSSALSRFYAGARILSILVI